MKRSLKQSNEFVIAQTMQKMKVSRSIAEHRVQCLLFSGLLNEGSATDRFTQLKIENYLSFDLYKLDYKTVFFETLNFPDLVKLYDKKSGNNMTDALVEITKGNAPAKALNELMLFDKFFNENIWAYFPEQSKYGLRK